MRSALLHELEFFQPADTDIQKQSSKTALNSSTVPLKQETPSDRKEMVTGAWKEFKSYRTENNKYLISLLRLHCLQLHGQMLLCFIPL